MFLGVTSLLVAYLGIVDAALTLDKLDNYLVGTVGNIKQLKEEISALVHGGVTPGVADQFSSSIDKMKESDEKIKAGFQSAQTAVEQKISALESATDEAVASKAGADDSDNSHFQCVRVEKAMLEHAEQKDRELQKARSAVTEPCQEQEDLTKFSWSANADDLAFHCDISVSDNCDAQLTAYRAQLASVFNELEFDTQEAGDKYSAAKKRCDAAKADVVRKQSDHDEAVKAFEKKRAECRQKHSSRGDAICAFGKKYQDKCQIVYSGIALRREIEPGTGSALSLPDMQREWRASHIAKCLLAKGIKREHIDDDALDSCAQSVDFEGGVGKMDFHHEEAIALLTPEKFSCQEETISFRGETWQVPDGDNPKSSDYKVVPYKPPVSRAAETPPFQHCGALTALADPDHDNQKCGTPGDGGRVFDFRDAEATESKCSEKCITTPDCVAYSGVFGQWCIGCMRTLDAGHSGSKAFKVTRKPGGVEDPEHDNKKCGNPGDSGRVFYFKSTEATESKCSEKCNTTPECIAYSGRFGHWCIGCNRPLDTDHNGAKAFKASRPP